MPDLLITYQEASFNSHPAEARILMRDNQVQKVNGIGLTSSQLNAAHAGLELQAAEHLMVWIASQITNTSIPIHLLPVALQRVPKDYATKAILYYTLKETFLSAFILKEQISLFCQLSKTEYKKIYLDLPEAYHWFPNTFYHANAILVPRVTSRERQKKSRTLKNVIYKTLGKALHPKVDPVSPGKRRILFFSPSPLFNDRLFGEFYTKVSQDKSIELVVIYYPSMIGGEKKSEKDLFEKHGIEFYNYSDFKSVSGVDPDKILDSLSGQAIGVLPSPAKEYLHSTLLNYEWTRTILNLFAPHLVFTPILGETGRWVADNARELGIPSVYVEYSLFTDDAFWMCSGVKFDKRLCIGPESINIWKKRNDPTPAHACIGYLGFHSSLAIRNNISGTQVLFASTWSGTNEGFQDEKVRILRDLIPACAARGRSLIIKKHPSETDTLVEEVVKELHQGDVRIISKGSQDELMELIAQCELVCCQNSSIGLEALFFNKAFCYIAPGGDRISAISQLSRVGYAGTYASATEMLKDLDEGKFLKGSELTVMRKKILWEERPAAEALLLELKNMIA